MQRVDGWEQGRGGDTQPAESSGSDGVVFHSEAQAGVGTFLRLYLLPSYVHMQKPEAQRAEAIYPKSPVGYLSLLPAVG